MVWARQASQDCHAAAATTALLSWPAAPTAGRHNFILVTCTTGAANAINTPAGWTLLGRVAIGNQTSDGELALFGRASSPAETVVNVTASGTVNVYGVEYTGGSLSIDVQNTGAPNATNVTSQVTGSVTSTDAGDLFLVGVGTSALNGGTTSWATATNILASQENKIILGERIPGSTVTYQDTASWTTPRHAVGLIVALHPGTTAVSDTDSAAATDDGESIAAAITNADTAAATDAESASAAVTESETAAETDAESVAGAVTQTDSAAATDAESIASTLSDTDSAGATDVESIAASTTETDSAAATDAESASASTTDTDSAAATDAESAAFASTDSDSAAATDSESVAFAFTDDDPANATDAESLAAILANDDSAAATDLESTVLAGVSQSDLALIAEGQAILVFVTDGDTAAVTEDESTGAQQMQTWLVGASFL